MKTQPFHWLISLKNEIKTHEFIRVGQRLSDAAVSELESKTAKFPKDYKIFLSEIGGAELFRDREDEIYRIFLDANPKVYAAKNGLRFLEIGAFDGQFLYFEIADNRALPNV